jgi:phospholipid/cholesterol/gamma-HCH transport system substrate-binding protein
MSFKIKNEVKIGLMVTISIVLLILGLNFLRGRGVFSREREYIAYYENTAGLQPSATVQLQGVSVGKVLTVELQKDRRVKVTLGMSPDVQIPIGTQAQLASADLISGTKVINLIFSNSTSYLAPGDTLVGLESGGILDNLTADVSPLMNVVQHTVMSLDSLLMSVNDIVNREARGHLNSSLASLDVALKDMALLTNSLNKQTESLAGVLNNANNITGNIAQSNAKITGILNNAERATGQFANAPVQKTLEDLQLAAANLQNAVAQINNTNGTVGMLLHDRKLYDNLNGAMGAIDTLLSDLRARPSRYINVSVFGRKSKD